MTEAPHASFHAAPNAADGVVKHGYTLPISDEMLAEAKAMRDAKHRWMTATPQERAQWAVDAKQNRAAERAQAPVVPLTLDVLLDKLGWSQRYAEHFVQPYCDCEDTRDGWERCQHAHDLDLNTWK